MSSTTTLDRASRRSPLVVATLSGLTLVLLIWIAALRPSPRHLWGDEGTYVAMTESLVRDGDLIFGSRDRHRAVTRQPGPPVTVILQQTEHGITYSKPVLYPLLALPLARVLGEWGMVGTNLFLLILALALSWRHLAAMGHRTDALWTLASFALGSVLLPYLGWKMSDVGQASLTLAGLILALGAVQRRDRHDSILSALAGGVCLGMAVSMRYPGAAFVAAAVAGLLLHRRVRRAVLFLAATVLTLLVINGISEQMIGAANPYKAVRASFNVDTGYPITVDEPPARRFDTARATQSATWVPPAVDSRNLYASLYFLIGRHTGLIAYFPIALLLIAYGLRWPSRIGSMLIGAVGVVAAFYLIWMPENYFGGSTFLGNRYFLGAFPALLVALRRLPSPRFLACGWIVIALSWSSALVSVAATREFDPSSQSHTRSGIFRLLPFETTAQKIDGVVDRFWDDDLVRFVDPFAVPARWSFELEPGQKAAEVMIAADWPGDSMLFVVSSSDPDLELEIGDRGASEVYSFPRPDPDPPGVVEFAPSSHWRRHAFWWKGGDKPYRVHTLRFEARSEATDRSSVIVRYLGRGRVLRPLAAEVEGPELPAQVAAGATTSWRIRARNTGRHPWAPDALLPIQLGYRILEDDQQIAGRGRARLETKVRPGELLDQHLDIDWPRESGTYRLVVELLRGPSARLGEAGRQALIDGEIRVDDRLEESREP